MLVLVGTFVPIGWFWEPYTAIAIRIDCVSKQWQDASFEQLSSRMVKVVGPGAWPLEAKCQFHLLSLANALQKANQTPNLPPTNTKCKHE